MKIKASPFRTLLAAIALLCIVPVALAQWSWKDKDGKRVFSDQPPPPSVPEQNILRRPPGSPAPAVIAPVAAPEAKAAPAAGADAAATAAAPKISGKDSELLKKKKDAETAQAAKAKADAEKNAAVKSENCARAKRAKASIDSGVRLSTSNAKGEREYLSETAKAAESSRIQGVIDSDCN
jgi:hypothetical protein